MYLVWFEIWEGSDRSMHTYLSNIASGPGDELPEQPARWQSVHRANVHLLGQPDKTFSYASYAKESW